MKRILEDGLCYILSAIVLVWTLDQFMNRLIQEATK